MDSFLKIFAFKFNGINFFTDLFLLFFSLILSIFLIGCSTAHYIFQSGLGQMAVMNRARSVEDVVRDPKTPPHVVVLLKEVPAIKNYAEKKGLHATSNYNNYYQVDEERNGRYVSWVVSASQPLRFESKVWTFPVAGSFTYLGWFDRQAALAYAEKIRLEEPELDVDVRGAPAYSTLGWFRDPIFSSMIHREKSALGDLVNVVLHESVHATVYVSGQSVFNESLAEFVAAQLTTDYLKDHYGGESEQFNAYMAADRRDLKYRLRYSQAYMALEQIYASDLSDAEKRAQKIEVLSTLKKDLDLKRDINNASLIQYRTYGTGLEELAQLWSHCDKNAQRFLGMVARLKSEDFAREQEDDFTSVVLKLLEKPCA